MYDTKTVTAFATDGTPFDVVIPVSIPTEDRAMELTALYKEHVRHPDGHWKGRAEALVPAELADDIAEAMDFHGSVIDFRSEPAKGRVALISKGYIAHGF